MLLLGAILLAIFVLPSPWGIVAVIAGGLIDIGESLVLLEWTRRRRSGVGVETLVGQRGVVSTLTQVRVAGERCGRPERIERSVPARGSLFVVLMD